MDKILLIKTQAIGDVLMCTPAIRAIRKGFPHAHIAMMVGEWSKDAVTGNPNVDEVITFDDRILHGQTGRFWVLGLGFRMKNMVRLLRDIRRRRFDAVAAFHISPLVHLFCALTGAKVRAGQVIRKNGKPRNWASGNWLLTHPAYIEDSPNVYAVEHYLQVARVLGCKEEDKRLEVVVCEEDIQFAEKVFDAEELNVGSPVVCFCPGGAKNPAEEVAGRRWHPTKYAQIALRLMKEAGARVVLLGSESDAPIAQEFLNHLSLLLLSSPAPLRGRKSEVVNLIGRTTLKQAAAVIARCDLLLTNDSAPLHLAVAMDTPCVVPFGPTSAAARLPDNERFIGIQSPLECSPCCWSTRFRGCRCPECMDAISVDSVWQAVKQQLERRKFARPLRWGTK